MSTHDSTINIVLPTEAAKNQARRRVLLDNAHVRVIETTYPVGSSVPMHTHPHPHVAYVVEGGVVETREPDGHVTGWRCRRR